MAELGDVLFCAAATAAIWTLIGLPVVTIAFTRSYAWLFAPTLGWAVHSVVTLPLFGVIGMGKPQGLAFAAIFVGAAALLMWRQRTGVSGRSSVPFSLGLTAAAILALGPMLAILPKLTSEGVTLALPIFDHSKIAMIDEIIRSGVPLKNAFFGEIGTPDRIAYYYLWHFSAAGAAVLTGVNGWEADAALTWFTAFASLLVMIGLAIGMGGRTSAALIVVMLAATASLRTALTWLWPDSLALIGWSSGLGGWLFQMSWAPQHVASAMCVVVACAMLPRLTSPQGWAAAAVIGLVGTAAFESSIWVGGVVFPLAATSIGFYCLVSVAAEQRRQFVARATTAAAIAVVLAIPFIHDQLAMAALRGTGDLIAIRSVEVLGSAIPDGIRRMLDAPAYWLIYLPIEFPAFYVSGLTALYLLFKVPPPNLDQRDLARAAAILVAAGLGIGWMLASIIGDNNDLGWRAVLPALMVLISASAALLSRWPPPKMAAVIAAAGVILSVPETIKIINENISGLRQRSERTFAATPSMWEAVRRHTSPVERVANNPLFLGDMTPWPVNISWALLADRRSCYAGNELAIPFAPIPAARRAEIETQFVRVFAGTPEPRDIEQLAKRFRCDTIVITPQDGAWQRDPFAASEFYRLAENKPSAWRIYRRAVPQP